MNKIIYTLAQTLRRAGYRFHEDEDPRVMAMRQMVRQLGGIDFSIEILQDGTWLAESKNIDGLVSGGRNTQNIPETLKDAIFTYFEIPPHLCNDALLTAQGEPLRLEQRVCV